MVVIIFETIPLHLLLDKTKRLLSNHDTVNLKVVMRQMSTCKPAVSSYGSAIVSGAIVNEIDMGL